MIEVAHEDAVRVGARDRAALVERVLAHLGGQPLDLMLVFVIDEGPRHGIEALRGPLGRRPRLGPARRLQIERAEARSGEVVLAEAQAAAARAGVAEATTHMLRGRPERAIVDLAMQQVDLVAIGAREGVAALPPGPESVGHVARAVLDHAPCSVLLVRR